MVDYNTYIHARPDGRVFYVGKGPASRSTEMSRSRNSHHYNIVKKYGADNILIGRMPCSSDAISIDLEKGMIKCFRRMGVVLANQTDGGEGTKGLIRSSQERKLISERLKQFWMDPTRKVEISDKISASLQNPTIKKRLSDKKLGNTFRLGKKNSPEHIKAIREANLGKSPSDETRKKMSESAKGRKASEATRLKMSQAQTKRYTNLENRNKTAEVTALGIKLKKEQQA